MIDKLYKITATYFAQVADDRVTIDAIRHHLSLALMNIYYQPGIVNPMSFNINTIEEVEPKLKDEKIISRYGWSCDCLSPLEISNRDGSRATGEAARFIIQSMKDGSWNG